MGSSDGGGGVGRAVGITSAVFLLVMVAVVAAVVVILLVVRKKRTVYLVKPGSSLARNSLATASTIGVWGRNGLDYGAKVCVLLCSQVFLATSMWRRALKPMPRWANLRQTTSLNSPLCMKTLSISAIG